MTRFALLALFALVLTACDDRQNETRQLVCNGEVKMEGYSIRLLQNGAYTNYSGSHYFPAYNGESCTVYRVAKPVVPNE